MHPVAHRSLAASHHTARPRECPPGSAVVPIAELTSANIAGLYAPTYGYGDGPSLGDTIPGVAEAAGAFPVAQQSGLDLPADSGSDLFLKVPGTSGGAGGGSTSGVAGSSGGGAGGGGGSGGAGGAGGSGSGPAGPGGPAGSPLGGSTGGDGGIVVIGPGSGSTPGVGSPAGGGPEPSGPGSSPGGAPGLSGPDSPPGGNGVSAAPEPATWAFMLIGLGGIGGAVRRRRVLALAI